MYTRSDVYRCVPVCVCVCVCVCVNIKDGGGDDFVDILTGFRRGKNSVNRNSLIYIMYEKSPIEMVYTRVVGIGKRTVIVVVLATP
jgi:hypothetical protein